MTEAAPKKKRSQYRKQTPTIFPFGLGVNRVGDNIIVLDFLDTDISKDGSNVISSIAMPREQAVKLAKSILNVFSDED